MPRDEIDDPYPMETFPLLIHPIQVLFILTHLPPSDYRMIDASSGVRRLRQLVPPPPRDEYYTMRVKQFQQRIQEQEIYHKQMMEKYQQKGKKKRKGNNSITNTAGEDDKSSSAATAETIDSNTVTPATLDPSSDDPIEMSSPSKRPKLDSNLPPSLSSSTSTITPISSPPPSSSLPSSSAPVSLSLSDIVNSIISSDSVLPKSSSLHIATCAFPLTDAVIASHTAAHPKYTTAQVELPSSTASEAIKISKIVNVLDLPLTITHESTSSNENIDHAEMVHLALKGICHSHGTRLHNCGLPNIASRLPLPFFRDQPQQFNAMMAKYSSFLHLWHDRFFLKPGTQFGCDWTAYEDFPSIVHSSYMVKVKSRPLSDCAADLTAADDQSVHILGPRLEPVEEGNIIRMASSINKIVLVMEPLMRPVDANSPPLIFPLPPSPCSCLDAFASSIRCSLNVKQFRSSIFRYISDVGLHHGPYPSQADRRAALNYKRDDINTEDKLETDGWDEQ